MERRTIMDIRMFMRMEQFMQVITIMSRKIMLTVKKNMSQRTMFTVKKNTTQKSIFTARMSMIWKMWRFMMKITLKSIWMRTMVTASRLNMTSTSGRPRSMRKSWPACWRRCWHRKIRRTRLPMRKTARPIRIN